MTLSRRTLVAATAFLPVAGVAAATFSDAPGAAAAPTQPSIRPRADWAGTLAPKGPLADEPDVRFLLVHHTQTPNTDTAEKIPARLQSIYRFHTSAEKGWADVAYNFFVDPFGTIWEGREGSLTRPVMGDATGGSQGHALLCCFIGDHTAEPPTPAAMASMTSLLAWLAVREGLDLAGPVTFTSRGSNKWRKGAEVTTEQVAGHRDMSATECPGEALYPLVAGQLLPGARALLTPPTPIASPTPTSSPTPSPSGMLRPTPTASEPPTEAPTAGVDGVVVAVGGGLLLTGLSAALGALSGRRGRRSAAEQVEQDHGPADPEGDEQADEEPDQRL